MDSDDVACVAEDSPGRACSLAFVWVGVVDTSKNPIAQAITCITGLRGRRDSTAAPIPIQILIGDSSSFQRHGDPRDAFFGPGTYHPSAC
jgi:hypothetical protein